jgi:predicted metal-dependent phosphoesterase TrpH
MDSDPSMVDLHSHTTASDGQHAPSQLVRLAAAAGVTHLAITDHDTVSGIPEGVHAAKALGLTLIPGIELSAFVGNREVHILGHFIDAEDRELGQLSIALRAERRGRMERMIQKLNALGLPVTMEQVLSVAGDAHLGRPHLARALVERGSCSSTKDAFERFLANGRPGFVERERISGERAIAMVRDAGGAATVAHPAVSQVTVDELRSLRTVGLSGLEVFHSDHKPAMQAKYLAIANELDLVPTAGSDFHGEKVAPGRRLGTANMELRFFAELQRRAAAP